MTRQSSFKRLVRARMDKTGESYTAAREMLLAEDGRRPAEPPVLTMSDAAIRARTGRGWEEWFDVLDAEAATERPHKEIARWLREAEGVAGWDAQSITVSYERARGRRAVGQRPGGFSVTAQKTVRVPVERLYEAFVGETERARWLTHGALRERTATPHRSARFDWDGGETRLVVGFESKGAAKSVVALEHERLPDAEQARRRKAFWRDRLTALATLLEGSEGGTLTAPDGTPIVFERTGAGPALVLVDGALCFRSFGPTARLAEILAADFTVYRYDRRGRGESGDTPPYAVEREVEDLEAVIGATGGPAFVFGLSSGGALAFEAAARGLPITRLALYEPPLAVEEDPEGTRAFAERLEGLAAAGLRGDAVEFFLASGGVPPEAIAAMRKDPSWALFESVAPTLVYDNTVLGDGVVPHERAAVVKVPALVANGGESPDFFRAAAQAMAAALPAGRHEVLDGQSWGQVEPEALAPVLRRFFDAG